MITITVQRDGAHKSCDFRLMEKLGSLHSRKCCHPNRLVRRWQERKQPSVLAIPTTLSGIPAHSRRNSLHVVEST